ncbi:MAG TPA: nuclear transport factor 2 family protein [Myxococcota bacterium]|nr:nuclear transport factor 2 family protein [Myxococcota bacterium]
MSHPTALVESYLAAWNERDARRREDLIAKTYTEDATYLDSHRTGAGYEGLSKMIAAVHGQFPDVYRFRLASEVESHHDVLRFRWEAGGTKEAPLHFGGTDFCVVAPDGRLASVTGFTDFAPKQ